MGESTIDKQWFGKYRQISQNMIAIQSEKKLLNLLYSTNTEIENGVKHIQNVQDTGAKVSISSKSDP